MRKRKKEIEREKPEREKPAASNAYRWTVLCKFYYYSVFFLMQYSNRYDFIFFASIMMIIVAVTVTAADEVDVIDIVVNLIGNCRCEWFSRWHTVVHMYICIRIVIQFRRHHKVIVKVEWPARNFNMSVDCILCFRFVDVFDSFIAFAQPQKKTSN